MIYNAIDGSVLPVSQEFLDDSNNPLLASPGYPLVRLLDSSKTLLSSIVASPSATPGTWTANLAIPTMNIVDKTELIVSWRFLALDKSKHTARDSVIVEPAVDSRPSDIVVLFDDSKFNITLPIYFSNTDTCKFQIYKDNLPLLDPIGNVNDPSVTTNTAIDKVTFSIPTVVPEPSLTAYMLVVRATSSGSAEKTFSYKLWVITPQILSAMHSLEDFVNKSRIENVIPELRYTDSDLLNYLERGLSMFNTLAFTTAFTGTNMLGPLLDGWVLCSTYYALCSQILAEGSLAFDFSGQGISLNVDRTPQLDNILGRIESAINDRVVPLKKQLAKQGITAGDGSAGKGSLVNPYAKAYLGMINSPTTRLRGWGSNIFLGKRS